jgi:hypothetical protein
MSQIRHMSFLAMMYLLAEGLCVTALLTPKAENSLICLVHVDGVRLCLWTAATNGPVVYVNEVRIFLWTAATNGSLFVPQVIWVWSSCEMITWQNRKTCLSATLSTINLTYIYLGTKPGLHSERPVTNCLSHSTALFALQPHDYQHCSWWNVNFCPWKH